MNAKHMEEKRKSSNITKFILFILICVFIYSSIQVGIWIISNIELTKLENGLYNEVAVDNKDSGTTQIDFEKLKAINNDVIGWIKIDNTNIDYPILKGETDEYYLRRDIYKNYSFSGSIFVDSRTKADFTDYNTVVYGHNLKMGKMFSQLTRIYKGELGKEVFVKIFTNNNKEEKYKVFSAYLGEQDLEIVQKNMNDSEKQNYIDNAIKRSNYKFDVEVNTNQKILTMITCDKTGEKRFVVNAIKK